MSYKYLYDVEKLCISNYEPAKQITTGTSKLGLVLVILVFGVFRCPWGPWFHYVFKINVPLISLRWQVIGWIIF